MEKKKFAVILKYLEWFFLKYGSVRICHYLFLLHNDNMQAGRKVNLRIKVNTLVSIILMLGIVVFMQSVSAKNVYYSLWLTKI